MYIWFQKGQHNNLAGPEHLHKNLSSSVSAEVFIKHANIAPSLLVLCISYLGEDFGSTNGRRWFPISGKVRFAKYFYNNF